MRRGKGPESWTTYRSSSRLAAGGRSEISLLIRDLMSTSLVTSKPPVFPGARQPCCASSSKIPVTRLYAAASGARSSIMTSRLSPRSSKCQRSGLLEVSSKQRSSRTVVSRPPVSEALNESSTQVSVAYGTVSDFAGSRKMNWWVSHGPVACRLTSRRRSSTRLTEPVGPKYLHCLATAACSVIPSWIAPRSCCRNSRALGLSDGESGESARPGSAAGSTAGSGTAGPSAAAAAAAPAPAPAGAAPATGGSGEVAAL
eukprot:SAG22_NODE_1526_length_4224_cov_3.171394_5_plen_257_part_00